MTMTLRQIPTDAQELATFKQAMRHLIGGVGVITAGSGEIRTGLTATSAISLSLDPPTMLVCVNRDASAWPVIQRERHYSVNILDSRQQDLADRFAGRSGMNGADRYQGARWRQFSTGAWGLVRLHRDAVERRSQEVRGRDPRKRRSRRPRSAERAHLQFADRDCR